MIHKSVSFVPGLVSIIIPTHNRGNLVLETLNSAISQTYSNIEIIVVDDHSNDNTETIIKNYIKNHPQIIYLKNKRKGACAARNEGLNYSHGEYIQFFDDDDLMKVNYIEKRLELLQSENVYYVACNYETFEHETGKIIAYQQNADIPHTLSSHLFYSALSTQCFLVKREAINIIGYWNESCKRWQDVDYFSRLFTNNISGLWINEALFKLRWHSNSITKSQGVNAVFETLYNLRKKWRPLLKNNQTLRLVLMWLHFKTSKELNSTNRISLLLKCFMIAPFDFLEFIWMNKIKRINLNDIL